MDDTDQNGQGGDASGVDDPNWSTASVSRTSAFRSFLAQRGAGTAAALVLKDGFGRILNSSADDKPDGSNPDRLRRGDTIGEGRHCKDILSRPSPVQDSSPEEANQANRASSLELGELPYSNEGGNSNGPRQGRDTGTKTNSRPSQLHQRLRSHRLNRSALDLMQSKKSMIGRNDETGGGKRQQKPPGAARDPASLSPVSSESSSTTSGDDTDGYDASKPSAWLKGASRINKFTHRRGWGGRKTEATVSKGLFFPCCESCVSLSAACRNICRYLHGCSDSRKAGGSDSQATPGIGRPAAGRLENEAYEWFGEFVGRGWPRKGLAPFPVYHLEEHLQVKYWRTNPSRMYERALFGWPCGKILERVDC